MQSNLRNTFGLLNCDFIGKLPSDRIRDKDTAKRSLRFVALHENAKQSERSEMKLIERPRYLNRLKGLQGTPDIKIIKGIRRSGKTELLRAFAEHLKQTDPDVNLIQIDFGDLKYQDHLKKGGLCGSYLYKNEEDAAAYIRDCTPHDNPRGREGI